MTRCVVIESPYAGDMEENIKYARRCALDCAKRSEASMASHLYYTQFLDDLVLADRELGIRLGLAWAARADAQVFYTDRGWSRGMIAALTIPSVPGRQIVFRSLNKPVEYPPRWYPGPNIIIESA